MPKSRSRSRKPKPWTMPAWMEPYREHICNTGGNDIEGMVNGDADPQINLPLSTLQACVKSQISFLYTLKEKGLLPRGNQLIQGFALAIGSLVRDHGEAAQAGAIMRAHGITLGQMIEAQVDKFDLQPIRRKVR